jgi:hypothetical protein
MYKILDLTNGEYVKGFKLVESTNKWDLFDLEFKTMNSVTAHLNWVVNPTQKQNIKRYKEQFVIEKV